MKITILGTANAWGPNPFLTPKPPWPLKGNLSKDAGGIEIEIRKYRTSILIESRDQKKILVDCGPDFSSQLREFEIGIVDAILITHPHPDHIGGLDELNLYKRTGRLPIPGYATKACWNCIRNDRGLGYVVDPLRLVSENYLLQDKENPSFSIGSVTVTPFPVEHHFIAPGAVGFLFEENNDGHAARVLYTGDLWAVSDPADPLFQKQCDVAIIECDRWDGLTGPSVGGGHMSFAEAVRMLNDGVFSNPRPSQVVFVHFGDKGPKGTGSSYQNWRESIIGELKQKGLAQVMTKSEDYVVGYEGLELRCP